MKYIFNQEINWRKHINLSKEEFYNRNILSNILIKEIRNKKETNKQTKEGNKSEINN